MKNNDIRKNSNPNHSSCSEYSCQQPKRKSGYKKKFRCFLQLNTKQKYQFKNKLKQLFNRNIEVRNHCEKYNMHVSNICISSGTTHRNTNVKITKESSYQERLERASRSKDINFISDHAYTSFREINELHDEIASIHNIRLQRTNTSEQIPVLKSNIHGQYYDPIEKIKWHLLPMDKSGTIFGCIFKSLAE